MDFHVEERRAWVRSSTHTLVRDRDPDFDFFRNDPTGIQIRTLRIWLADQEAARPLRKAYLGSLCACGQNLSGPELYRLFRQTTACAPLTGETAPVLRRRLIRLLRDRLKSN